MSALGSDTWIEFKPLFEKVYASLREHHQAHGSEETLRLTSYDLLQRLVVAGCVEKADKRYRLNPEVLESSSSAEHVAAEHCRELLAAVQNVKAD